MAEIHGDFQHLPLDAIHDAVAAPLDGRESGDYWDLRVHRDKRQAIHVRDTFVESVNDTQAEGIGIRVLHDGAWGFAATTDVSPDGARRALTRALGIAKQLRRSGDDRVEFLPEPGHHATWVANGRVDPFTVPVESKIELMLGALQAAIGAGARFGEFHCEQVQETKFFANSDGSEILQQRVRLDPVMDVGLLDDSRGGRVEMIRADTMPVAQGWEYMTEHGFSQEAVELVSHLKEKLASPSIEPGRYDLVIDPSNLWLTIHESVGHATELDRALGYEANYAGTTFVTPDRLGELRYGSAVMHVTGDRTVPNGLATIGFDDDGVAAQEWDIIADGILVGGQTDRQVAGRIGLERSNGCAFADRWNKFPLERMPNVSLQPDPHRDTPIADLIGAVTDGIYIVGEKSMSIDQQRYNFHFTGQRFYRIRHGKIAGQVRDVGYQSRTPDFWGALEGVSGKSSWRLQAAFSCSKGEPDQEAPVSHGCPAGLFRQINVVNTGTGQ
jgi:TldD protein